MRSQHREWLIEQLESWQETYDNPGDEAGYMELEYLIRQLKYRYKQMTNEDWDNIIFHLWQQKGQD
jgi:hypothetical protein